MTLAVRQPEQRTRSAARRGETTGMVTLTGIRSRLISGSVLSSDACSQRAASASEYSRKGLHSLHRSRRRSSMPSRVVILRIGRRMGML